MKKMKFAAPAAAPSMTLDQWKSFGDSTPAAAPSGAPATLDDWKNFGNAPAPEPAAAPTPEVTATTTPDEPGLGESILRGAKQGITLGLGDEISGKVQEILGLKSYEQARDEARAADAAARKAHRWGFGLGEVVGGFAAPVPGGGLGTIAKGAVTGGIAALGNSEADLTKGDYAGAAKDVAFGAGLGGALGGLAGKASEKLVQGAEGRSMTRAAEALKPKEKGGDAMALLGSFATGSPLPYIAKKVALPAAKALGRGADEILAKIATARAAGSSTAALVQDAIQAGIPKSVIAEAVAGSAGE